MTRPLPPFATGAAMSKDGVQADSGADALREKFCLACDKLGHLTTECWSTVSLSTPAARELMRLTRAALVDTAGPSAEPSELTREEEIACIVASHFNCGRDAAQAAARAIAYRLACLAPQPVHAEQGAEPIAQTFAEAYYCVMEEIDAAEAVFGECESLRAKVKALVAAAQPAPAEKQAAETLAWRDVKAERQRQMRVEGWMPDHDDKHDYGDLAKAAAVYAVYPHSDIVDRLWPWEPGWLKPGSPRRNLVKAGALILAEIERLDRLTPSASTPETPASPEQAAEREGPGARDA